MADATQRDASKPGDSVTCTISPTDGKGSAGIAVVETYDLESVRAVPARQCKRAQLRGD